MAESRDAAFDRAMKEPSPRAVLPERPDQSDGSVRYGSTVITVRNPCPPGTLHYEPPPLPGALSGSSRPPHRMPITNVGVVGCGLMGSGIVQVAAQAGFQVLFVEADDQLVKRGLARLHETLEGLVEARQARGARPGREPSRASPARPGSKI
mgnify:CR=1 FL=1